MADISVIGRQLKVDRKEIKWEGLEGIAVGQDRDRWWAAVNAVMNLRVA